ncbi:hypothetical protein RHODGE_RHODGE_01462 [Rhodoplanes serenus]|uniref:Uncharacterized protein n=1 Tax=Rhodoplanes serenus TaxID=200615 RepID=A0A447CNW3_9BRAD|nr:DUF6384 family protein [Rhodoplanes serenus]VCU06814.1 hypothetical protein RHODGE_RHODGE_01462 [Rhodoplanes serenus]
MAAAPTNPTAPAGAAPTATAPAAAPRAAGTLDELMLAMDVVDTLRHRDVMVERELAEETREQALIERLRAIYQGQGIAVPDSILAQGVKALKESRFVYTPPAPGWRRTLALAWVARGRWGKRVAAALAVALVGYGAYDLAVVRPREKAAEAARVELAETLPRRLAAGRDAVRAEALDEAVRQRADALAARGRAALDRGDVAEARATVAELDALAAQLRQDYVLRIAGRPEDRTGIWREHPSFRGRAYFVVVDAVDPQGRPVPLPIRNDETNATETVSRFAVRVPQSTYEAVRDDKQRNGIVQNTRLAEKRRGALDPVYRMPVLEGRITAW